MPAIADQVATIEHDLSIAQTLVDSLRSENSQLKNALAALNVDHSTLQVQHADALALVDETRQHADGVASAALTMLKVSRRSIGTVAPSEGSKALAALAPSLDAQNEEAVAEAIEPEKTDVRPELPATDQGFSAEVNEAVNEMHADLTGKFDEMTNAERMRAHMPGEDPLPIFLTPRALPSNLAPGQAPGQAPANVLG